MPSTYWREYFHYNDKHLRSIPWNTSAPATSAEVAIVAPSVQEFQLGESSEGRRFIDRATAYARKTGDWDYVEALKLFIAEEQRHGRELATFLLLHGVPLLKHTAVDGVFRGMRQLAGLEVMVTVLVTAEVVAQVYYQALCDATSSEALRVLCEQILADEEKHVQFQCERLAILRQRRNSLLLQLCVAAQSCLLAATCCVLWRKHGPTLRAGGFGFTRFVREAFAANELATRIADPKRYDWTKA
jgi:hypothetical protein